MTYSPGLKDIVAAETRLSSVDGEAGELVLAGYPLEEIAERATFEEMAYLIWHGSLPDAAALDRFTRDLAARRTLPIATRDLLRAAAAERQPVIDAVRMAVASLPSVDDAEDARCLVARMPTIVAAYWRLLHGNEPVDPDPCLGHVANLLYMLTGESPGDGGEMPDGDGGMPDDDAEMPNGAGEMTDDRHGMPSDAGEMPNDTDGQVRALTTYLNTVIDHGMNASTFTARVIASTRSDFVSAVTGAIGALKGPLHGGAPGPVIAMLEEIGDAGNAERWLRDKLEAGERLMGFGHAVYRVRDPRADVLSRAARTFFDDGHDLYALAQHTEKTAIRLLEEYKPGRRLQTNVEFYTALLLHGLGIHPDLFTPMFAIGRVAGWTVHCMEQRSVDRIFRPESRYSGDKNRRWLPIEDR